MQARDVMTSPVVSARPDMSAREVAKLLLDNRISAVPVVDEAGVPIGMVSEGDLIGRGVSEREARREWWLEMLAEGTRLSPTFLDSVQTTVRQVMVAPVVTVGEDAPISEVARLLEAHRIKRVPVVRDGRVVGIVSRANLLRTLAAS